MTEHRSKTDTGITNLLTPAKYPWLATQGVAVSQSCYESWACGSSKSCRQAIDGLDWFTASVRELLAREVTVFGELKRLVLHTKI